MLLESTLGVADRFEADGRPAVGDTGLLCEAAAATGTENKDTSREEDARLMVEANSLAACADLACRRGRGRAGVGRGKWDVEQLWYPKISGARGDLGHETK